MYEKLMKCGAKLGSVS